MGTDTALCLMDTLEGNKWAKDHRESVGAGEYRRNLTDLAELIDLAYEMQPKTLRENCDARWDFDIVDWLVFESLESKGGLFGYDLSYWVEMIKMCLWLFEAKSKLTFDFGLSMDDAGIDEVEFYKSNKDDAPCEAVERFGLKHDLDLIR